MGKTGAIVLLVVGIIFVIYGIQSADSLSSRFSELFTGTPTDKTIWMFIVGAVCTVTGLVMLGRGSKS